MCGLHNDSLDALWMDFNVNHCLRRVMCQVNGLAPLLTTHTQEDMQRKNDKVDL